MGKNGIRQVNLIQVDYDTMDQSLFDALETLYKEYHFTPKELLSNKLPYANYLAISNEDDQMIGMSSYREINKRVVRTERTILYPHFRGLGYGKMIATGLERFLKSKNYGKMTCQVYTDNFKMIMLKLKQGHIIEGVMRNHDAEGVHEYFISKEL